jgi:hypothetical protein
VNGWMIAVDGSAVNLARVERVNVGLSSAVDADGRGKRWFVQAEFNERRWSILASKLESREAAVAWIEQRFRGFDRHVDGALDHLDKPAGLRVDGTYAYDPQSR